MALIAISRQLCSGGDEIALLLAKKLNYRLVDKMYLEEKLDALGLNPEKRSLYDEKKPGFWASLSENKDMYEHYLKTAMLVEAKTNNVIFVGRGAFQILKNIPSLVSVSFISEYTNRISVAMQIFSCDEHHAKKIIDQNDHDRIGFHKYFFDIDSDNPEHFNIVLKTSSISQNVCVDVLATLTEEMITDGKNRLGLEKIYDLELAHRIETDIMYKYKVPVYFLEIKCFQGNVEIFGVVHSDSISNECIKITKNVEGVHDVSSSMQTISDYPIIP